MEEYLIMEVSESSNSCAELVGKQPKGLITPDEPQLGAGGGNGKGRIVDNGTGEMEVGERSEGYVELVGKQSKGFLPSDELQIGANVGSTNGCVVDISNIIYNAGNIYIYWSLGNVPLDDSQMSQPHDNMFTIQKKIIVNCHM